VAHARTGSARKSSEPIDSLPLDEIIHIAAFRSELRAFLRHSEAIARRWQLTPQRYMLLLAIKGAPDGSERMSITDLANRLSLSANTVTELCARAEAAGLVDREPAIHDLRVVYMRLTQEGERRLCGALLESESARAELIDAFGELAKSFGRATRPRRSRSAS
jgi:DNA-binding MarR family transcriptional regulator